MTDVTPATSPLTHANHDSDGEFLLYPDKSGRIMVSLRCGDIGVFIEDLLPLSGRGQHFGDFKVADYLNYAQMILATPKQWGQFNERLNHSTIPQGQSLSVSMPAIDLVAYKLEDSQGAIDYAKVTSLLSIVAELWDNKPSIVPPKGIVYELFAKGLSIAAIKQTIRYAVDNNMMSVDGQVNIKDINNHVGVEITKAIHHHYNQYHHLPATTFEPRTILLWNQWTRSTSERHADFKSPDAVIRDYQSLRILNAQGQANIKQVHKVAQFIWEHHTQKPSFQKTLTFIRQQERQAHQAALKQATEKKQKARSKNKRAQQTRKKNRR